MNNVQFTKEEILLNTYNMSKEACKLLLEKLMEVNNEYLYSEYLDLLEDQLDITFEIESFLIRNKYVKVDEIGDEVIDKMLKKMVKKIENISMNK